MNNEFAFAEMKWMKYPWVIIFILNRITARLDSQAFKPNRIMMITDSQFTQFLIVKASLVSSFDHFQWMRTADPNVRRECLNKSTYFLKNTWNPVTVDTTSGLSDDVDSPREGFKTAPQSR